MRFLSPSAERLCTLLFLLQAFVLSLQSNEEGAADMLRQLSLPSEAAAPNAAPASAAAASAAASHRGNAAVVLAAASWWCALADAVGNIFLYLLETSILFDSFQHKEPIIYLKPSSDNMRLAFIDKKGDAFVYSPGTSLCHGYVCTPQSKPSFIQLFKACTPQHRPTFIQLFTAFTPQRKPLAHPSASFHLFSCLNYC